MEYIYAALLLHKLGKHVDSEHLHKVIAAAGEEPDESKIKSLVASLKGVDIAKELENAALVSAAPSSGAGHKEEKKEEKPKEEKKAAAAEGLSALFG
ncbi:MAG: 50S ribosomal protein L12 [Nanoarchaeota archaeon]